MTLKVYVDPADLPWTMANTYAQIRLRGTSTISGKSRRRFGSVDVPPGLNDVEVAMTWPGGTPSLPAPT